MFLKDINWRLSSVSVQELAKSVDFSVFQRRYAFFNMAVWSECWPVARGHHICVDCVVLADALFDLVVAF